MVHEPIDISADHKSTAVEHERWEVKTLVEENMVSIKQERVCGIATTARGNIMMGTVRSGKGGERCGERLKWMSGSGVENGKVSVGGWVGGAGVVLVRKPG